MKLFFTILLFAFSTSATPGPNNIMLMTSGLNYGIKRSLPHFFGICIGFPLMVLAVGMGLGTVFISFPVLHTIIKYIGAAYMLYLAYKIATSKAKLKASEQTKPLSFIQAALFQWVNPKAWVMAIGAISAYTTAAGNVFLQVLIIAGTFFLVGFPCIGSWMFFGAGLKRFLRTASHQTYFNYSMAFLLFISIVLIFLE